MNLVMWSSEYLVIDETIGLVGTKHAWSSAVSLESESLKERTMAFGVAVLQVIDKLPVTASGQTVGRQLAQSATSVGANYRGACIARSRAEFIAKLGVVVEEADEAVCWIELTRRGRLLSERDVAPVWNEAIELRAIFWKSLGTARVNARQVTKTITK